MEGGELVGGGGGGDEMLSLGGVGLLRLRRWRVGDVVVVVVVVGE